VAAEGTKPGLGGWMIGGIEPNDAELQLYFEPSSFLAVGSPIAFFLSIRRNSISPDGTVEQSWSQRSGDSGKWQQQKQDDVTCIGPDFSFPSCKNFFNLFHPHDPVAYRIEPLLHTPLKGRLPIAHNLGHVLKCFIN
jgi:hypothetical protein